MLAHQLFFQIQAYLNGYSTLDNLENWLISNLKLIQSSNDDETKLIADELDADLVWLREGLITEEAFKAAVRELIRPTVTFSANATYWVSCRDY